MRVLGVFRGRTQAMQFYYKLKGYQVACNLVPTPKEANVGCGLSVEFFDRALPKAKLLARQFGGTFYGFFRKDEKFGRILIVRLP